MRIIAHRGNLTGPNPEMENNPSYLLKALGEGYDVEVDVWKTPDGLFLGHDIPDYKIERSFLCNKRVWSHAKTIETFYFLSQFKDINTFYQTEEDVVLTSRGFFWSHSKNKVFNEKTICTDLNPNPSHLSGRIDIYGFCTDYCLEASSYLPKENKSFPFKLLILDIDGVMTDGTKTYGLLGEVLSKKYCDLDFTAIKRFKSAGIKVCFLSGDTTVNEEMAESRKIDFFHARADNGNIDKSDFVNKLTNHYGVHKSEMAYVGDDYYDLSIIESLKFTYCPSTANGCIKERCSRVLDSPGGHGVVAELYEILKDGLDYAFPIDSIEVNPK